MTIREYANECGVEIVGKLTIKKVDRDEYGHYIVYTDEAMNEYYVSANGGHVIVTIDGDVY